jgi:RNA polymerase sigma factor (sigma-70 family)
VDKTDFDLLDAWQQGDTAAGSTLFNRHFDSVFRFFDRKVDGDAADLCQRTFLACVEAGERFRRHSSFRTFLFSIARHELYSFWRTKRRSPELDFGTTSIVDLAPTPSHVALAKQQHRLLLEALRSIPLDLQIVVELHFWESLSGPELAEVLEIPEGTVRSRLRRARETLDAKLEELATSPAILANTVNNLDGWARSLRDELGQAS